MPRKPPKLQHNRVNHKREKMFNSRIIRTELNDRSFTNPTIANTSVITFNSMGNKLDAPSFLKSREFEIKSLEKSQLKSKYSSSTRVFQSLPRELRRRTASHNVRRVPKRMRPRALKEMGLSLNTKDKKETKGVSKSGKPLKKVHSRGRELYRLRRKSQLLKYAGKHKLSGHLIDGSPIDIKKLDLRNRLKMIRAQIEKIESDRMKVGKKPNTDVSDDANTLLVKDRRVAKQAVITINNLTGAYDNTSVNESSGIHRISSLKYATRQTKFKWLPTHVWHAKRAKMVKRWGWNLVNQPTMKCFRKTSRSWRVKGCIAWDTSYFNTIILNCASSDLHAFEILKDIYSHLSCGKALKTNYISGYKAWEGFIHINEEPVCVGSLLWIRGELSVRLVVRFHPSVYELVLNSLLEEVRPYDAISLHDCRYSIGSITVAGPKALYALQAIIHCPVKKCPQYQLWKVFSQMNDVNTIPSGSCFSFEIDDPRLWNQHVTPHAFKEANVVLESLCDLQTGNAVNKDVLDKLFSIEGRINCYKNQQSLKQLGKRRTPERSGKPIPRTDADPTIPICIIKHSNGYNILLPWFWVMPVWYQLVHVPHLMIGGMKQMNQFAYEKSQLSFEDLIFTRQGFINGRIKMEQCSHEWNRKPKSKRVQYDALNLGSETGEKLSPFGCDWRSFQVLRYALNKVPKDADNSQVFPSEFDEMLNRVIKNKFDAFEIVKDIKKSDKGLSLLGRSVFEKLPVRLDRENETVVELAKAESYEITSKGLPQLQVRAIAFECCSRGHITDNARIYQIPESQKSYWISFGRKVCKDVRGRNMSTNQLGVPGSEFIVGLSTSATINLVRGCSTGVGFIDASSRLCEYLLVRNVGSDICQVCTWHYIVLR
ncbi:hypothetical protein FOA43_004204 [Brettanomyces nanus]|uniref:Uncharacterized protein n=1 Tax=Eeniella nana TaxID=13502 RepID=A0A875RQF7_EENNA|nr:uncharacterized protein FOA43_004204 [Brettanomyces nanus]QPG76810.1 hypothetical protein FOA43_004204 [Brettanomyces nanus]